MPLGTATAASTTCCVVPSSERKYQFIRIFIRRDYFLIIYNNTSIHLSGDMAINDCNDRERNVYVSALKII